jgi:hypothetical protein
MCDIVKFNYKPETKLTQYDLDVHNIEYYINLYNNETDAKKTCGPGQMLGNNIPFNKSLFNFNLYDDKNIVIIKENIIITLTDISFKDRICELTYFKIRPTHIFNIMFSYEEYSNTYRFDLYLSPKVDPIYDMILLNSIKIKLKSKASAKPKITIKNGKLYSVFDGEERFEKSLRDFFYFDFFQYGNVKKCTPIVLDNLKRKVYSEEICIQRDDGALKKIVFEDKDIKYEKNMYNITLKDNLINFSKYNNIIFDLYSFNCDKDIDIAGKIFGIKKMYVVYGAIGIIFICFISLIISCILMMTKSKSKSKSKNKEYKSSKSSKNKKFKK